MADPNDSSLQSDVLQLMPRGVSWFEEDDENNIKLRKARSAYFTTPSTLSESARAVLAFNQACSVRGFGKVYALPRHPVNPTEKGSSESYHAHKAIAELFYVPEKWSAKSQHEWMERTPTEQLHLSTARHGWVSRSFPVLPFAFDLQEFKRKFPMLQGLTLEPLTVYISPNAYVGPTAAMRSLCTDYWQSNKKGEPTGEFYFMANSSDWRLFDGWKVTGMTGIFDALYMYYCDGEFVCYYGELVDRFIRASRVALRNQPEPPNE